MAATVVYDGAVAGGTLFQGKKFWVAQRVPSRSRWIGLITANGGEIVPLEKHADIMIADHARKDAPPGSFSWTYIEKSVANGVLEDLENHRAGPAQSAIRPVGSDRPTRGTRTPFSAADDRALAIWVTKAEARGLSTKGNTIYEQLEKSNPRHTYQSWRDRWVKYLQYQPRPELAANDATPGPVHEQPVASRSTASLSKVSPKERSTPLPSQSKHKAQQGREVSRPAASPKKPVKGQPFTEEDAKLLLSIYDDIMNIDEIKLIDAWEKWADNYPQHTASEWFKFWIEEIKPLRQAKRRKLNKSSSTTSPLRTKDGRVSSAPLAATEDSAYQEVGKKRPQSQDSQIPEEAGFEADLKEFALNYEIEVDFQPVVDGRQIRLFDLWQQLVDLEFGESADLEAPEKWKIIASRLGFKESRHPNAPSELLNIYESMLAEFFEQTSLYREYLYLREILDENGTLSETQIERYQVVAPPGHELLFREADEPIEQDMEHEVNDEADMLETASSQRQNQSSMEERGESIPSRHQSQSFPRQHDVTVSLSRRQEKGKARMLEVPSTPPEDFINIQERIHNSSPIRRHILNEEHQSETESISDDGEGIFVRTSLRRSSTKVSEYQLSRRAKAEPETQDFHFSVPAERSYITSGSQRIIEDASGAGDSFVAVAGSIPEDSTTQSETNSEQEEAEFRALVDRYISLGYPEEVVTQAMLATTLETGDVATVMEAIMQGAGIPENIEGVWTFRDDEAIGLPEREKEYARIVAKHGKARCIKRRQFLNEDALKDLI